MAKMKRPYKKLLKLSEEEMKAIQDIAKAYNLDRTNAIRVAIMNEWARLKEQGRIPAQKEN